MSLPDTMNAVFVDPKVKGGALDYRECRVPYPGDGEYLIKVAAAGVNRPDIIQRQGHYPAPKGLSDLATHVLGLEVSGEIVVTGRNTSRYKVGDHVCALVSGGGYSQYCVTPEETTLPVPENISVVEAASLPETYFTVWHNVFQKGQLKPQEWLLLHGGASGIGSTAIQLAKAFGAHVVTTVSSDDKAEFCQSLGADKTINYLTESFVDVVKSVTNGHGADVILDMIGGDYIDQNIKCAAEDGRIVQIAFLNGSIAEVNFMRLMLKRLVLTGSTLRSRSLAFKAQLAKDVETQVWPMFAGGHLKSVVDRTFSLKDAGDAHNYMESRQNKGKVVLVNGT